MGQTAGQYPMQGEKVMAILLGIDPGTKNPTGIAMFSEGRWILTGTLLPEGRKVSERIKSVLDGLDYYIAMGVTEIACEQIVQYPGRSNLHGLMSLVQDIKALAHEHKLPISFYMPSQWQGNLRGGLWKEFIRQEWKLPEGTSEHCLAAVGIAAYHLRRGETCLL